MVVKSSYTFKVMPGTTSKWQVECVIFNQSTKIMEPISASPQSKPKYLKKIFGPIKSFSALDGETLEIENDEDSRIQLLSSRLTPMLDSDDTGLKKTLIAVKDKGCKAIVSALSEIVDTFKSLPLDSGCSKAVVKCPTVSQSSMVSEDDIEKISQESGFEDMMISQTNATQEEVSETNLARTSSNCTSTIVSSQTSKNMRERTLSVKITKHLCLYDENKDQASSVNVEGVGNDTELRKGGTDTEEGMENSMEAGDVDEEGPDMMETIENIIHGARYQNIRYDSIEIPKQVKIDQDKVNHLKELLKRTPDKTQTFIGVTRITGDDGKRIGYNQVWVNAELYLAKFQLEMEKNPEEASDVIFAVVHVIYDCHEIDTKIVGSFLNRNSIEFSAKIHTKMMYQDLLRMACITLDSDNSERSRNFLKSSLRSFSKGNKNANTFMAFASQNPKFLNMFEKFLSLYEEGSLHGQGLSLKHIVDNKKRSSKIEVPLTLIKLHLDVNPKFRDDLLNQLIVKEITFADYRLSMEKQAKLLKVKSKVESRAGQPFETLKEAHPKMFSDDVLSVFINAKTGNSGQNAHYNNLVKHVDNVVKEGEAHIGDTDQMFSFVENDKLSVLDVSRKVKFHNAVVLVLSNSDDKFNKDSGFAVKDEVLKSDDTIGIIVNDDEYQLRKEMSIYFEEESEVIVEYIFMKQSEKVSKGGFTKEYLPVAIFGNKKLFINRDLKTFYHGVRKDVLPVLLSSCLDVNTKILYIFDSITDAVDLDPQSSLAKRKISVTYLGKKVLLEELSAKLKRKCL